MTLELLKSDQNPNRIILNNFYFSPCFLLKLYGIFLILCSFCISLFSAELSKTNYEITFGYGSTYKLYEDQIAIGNLVLDWNLGHASLAKEYLLTLQPQTTPYKLASSDRQELEYSLFFQQKTKPVLLFDGDNFEQAAIRQSELKRNAIVSFPFVIQIPSHQYGTPGPYKAHFIATLYGLNREIMGTSPLEITITMASSQELFFFSHDASSESKNYTLQFGEVKTPTKREDDLKKTTN